MAKLTLSQIDSYRSNPNMRQMFGYIGHTEGTDRLHGYYTNVGGKRIDNVSSHPNVVGLRTKQGPSTAFGRFQITKQTFDDIAPQYGIKDMTPANQERIAVILMNRKGALNDVVTGKTGNAISKLGGTWASLPSSKYGQPTHSWKDAGDFFGGKIKTDYAQYANRGLGKTQSNIPHLAASLINAPTNKVSGLSSVLKDYLTAPIPSSKNRSTPSIASNTLSNTITEPLLDGLSMAKRPSARRINTPVAPNTISTQDYVNRSQLASNSAIANSFSPILGLGNQQAEFL